MTLVAPLTYQLLNFLTERMTTIEARKVSWWSRDTISRVCRNRIVAYFIFGDWLTSEITINTLGLLVIFVGMPDRALWRYVAGSAWVCYAPLLWLGLKFVLVYLPSLVSRVRCRNLKSALTSSTERIRCRAAASTLLTVVLFLSPVVLFLSQATAGQSSPLPIVVGIAVYMFSWLALTLIWAPVSASHVFMERQDMFSDLGKQQRLSFDHNADHYEEDDVHRERTLTVETAVDHLSGLRAQPLRVLYAGCGPGEMLGLLRTSWDSRHPGPVDLRVDATDVSPRMLGRASARAPARKTGSRVHINYVLGDFLDLGHHEGYYNAVLCLNNTFGNLIHNTLDSAPACRDAALRVFKQVLAPEGFLVMTVYSGHPGRTYTERLRFIRDGRGAEDSVSQFGPNDWILELDVCKEHPGVGTSLLYSHWFSPDELAEQVEDVHQYQRDKLGLLERTQVLLGIWTKPS